MIQDDLDPPRGVAYGVLFSAVLWILIGGGLWALLIHWGWIR